MAVPLVIPLHCFFRKNWSRGQLARKRTDRDLKGPRSTVLCQNHTEAEIPKCGRNAEKMRVDIGRQKGRGFNLCVAPSPRNQVSRISDGAEKDLE